MNVDLNQSGGTAGKNVPRRFGRLAGKVATVIVAIGLTGVVAGAAVSGWAPGPHGFGSGFGHHGMMMDGEIDPAEVEDHVTRMVAHLAIEIDATDEQKQKLTTILVSAANDLMPLRAEIMESRQAGELIGLLTQPTVDRTAIEAFRADKMALADRASLRIAKALGEAAEVLTPAQRTEIGERLEFLTRFGSPFHRG